MGGIDMNIIYDKPENTFRSGEMVAGWLVIKAKKKTTLKSISVKIKGKAKTLCHENGYRRKKYSFKPESEDLTDYQKRMDHSGVEKYFENNITLLGRKGQDEVLEPGERCFKFQMMLPTNIPSSFDGAYGHVCYTVKGRIERQFMRSHTVKKMFKVISLVDLNLTPDIKYPLTMNNQKFFLHGLSKSGPLSLVTKIDVIGFDLHLTVDVDNATDVDITAVKYELYRHVVFYSSHRSHFITDNSVILNGQLNGSVPQHTSNMWARSIKIPENSPPSFMKTCKIIDLNYRLMVRAKPSGVHLSLQTDMPIIIGTKPVIVNTRDRLMTEGLPTFPTENDGTRSKWSNSRFESYF